MSSYSPVLALKPVEPVWPLTFGNHTAVVSGVGRDVADGLFEGAQDDLGADLLVAGQLVTRPSARPEGLGSGPRRRRGTIPSSAAARVAWRASSTRALTLLHLGLGRRSDADDHDATGDLRQAAPGTSPCRTLLSVSSILASRSWSIRLTMSEPLRRAALDDRRSCPC